MSIKSKLRALSLRHPTISDIEEINRQIDLEDNDRGAALLAATLLENALRWAIYRRLLEVAYKFSFQSSKYFENEKGLFCTFESKIMFAQTLSIIGPDTFHNIDLIKGIRNAFAHAGAPITFATPEIADACNALKAPADLKGKKWSSPRDKFIAGCYVIASDLIIHTGQIKRVRADELESTKLVPVMPRSLP